MLTGFTRYAAPAHWHTYVNYAMTGRAHPWRRAMFLDLLLADVFASEVHRTNPNFATLFVNAAAHIQHHYLFSSSVYDGPGRNPAWYIRAGEDPVLEVYELYDRMIARNLRAFPKARVMIGTGLHQNPHPSVTFYWRLRDHAGFLQQIGLEFSSATPRMSRDFLVSCASSEAASRAEAHLATVTAADGTPLFEVDNRGTDLFVMLSFPRDIPNDMGFLVGGKEMKDLRSHVAFVALKNGEHDGIGYFVDTGRRLDPDASPFPLSSIPEFVHQALLGTTS